MQRAPIIAVDFDGVIARYDGWKGIGVYGEPTLTATVSLQTLRERGWKIIIWTCRDDVEKELIAEYLRKHDIPFDTINERVATFTNSHKVYADIYVDDRAVHFDTRAPASSWLKVSAEVCCVEDDIAKGGER